jgi:hypothetical protein
MRAKLRRTNERWAAVLCLLLSSAGQAADGISCHIHPPGSTPERPRGIIGPFPSTTACEQARRDRFGSVGRCHCIADFSPRWVPPAQLPMPGDALSS